MFKWPMLAAAAVVIGLYPTERTAQRDVETVFAIPSQTTTFTAHYVAHDAGLFQKEGLKVAGRYLVGVASPNVPQLESSQKVGLVAKLLDPKDAVRSLDGFFTDKLVR